MFQQTLAVSTAIFMSASLLSPHTPTPTNESIHNISITQLDSIDSVRHNTSESNQSPNWQDKPPGSEANTTPSITQSESPGSGESDSIPGRVKTPSKDIPEVKGEKEKVITKVSHKELKWNNYTIKVWLGGARKNIPTLSWSTKDERAIEWLEIGGLGYTIETWKKLGNDYKIDYSLPLCIAWADSHLGKANKSKNNIGNVGNNDRGDVVHFATLDKWIEAIFSALWQWRWMKGHIILGALSGEGRKIMWLPWCAEEKNSAKKCYASSLVVWHTNVSNCLSVIHNRQIDGNYEFRL